MRSCQRPPWRPPGRGPFRWVVGAFALDETVDTQLLRYQLETVVPLNPPTPNTMLFIDNESRSVFGQGTYRVSDAIEILGGARYSEDKQSFRRILPAAPTGVQFDETYVASQIFNSSSADGGTIYGARRQYSLRVTYRFE